MSKQSTFSDNTSKNLRCFKVDIERYPVMPDWVKDWREELVTGKFKISSRHEEALARLVPLLLCGEQSAVKKEGAKNLYDYILYLKSSGSSFSNHCIKSSSVFSSA